MVYCRRGTNARQSHGSLQKTGRIGDLFESLPPITISVILPNQSSSENLTIQAHWTNASRGIYHVGVPREFPHEYGTIEDIDKLFKLTPGDIREKIKGWIEKE